MGSKDEYDPLRELAALVGWENPDKDEAFERGLVGICDPDTGKLLTIRFLSEAEKDTLRRIASEITLFTVFRKK